MFRKLLLLALSAAMFGIIACNDRFSEKKVLNSYNVPGVDLVAGSIARQFTSKGSVVKTSKQIKEIVRTNTETDSSFAAVPNVTTSVTTTLPTVADFDLDFCIYATSRDTEEIPDDLPALVFPGIGMFDFGEEDGDVEVGESGAIIPDNFYQVRVSGGGTCAAEITLLCNGWVNRMASIGSEGEIVPWSSDCPESHRSVSCRCTEGSYQNRIGSGSQLEDGVNVCHAWRMPGVDEGRYVIEVVDTNGHSISARVDVRPIGMDLVVQSLNARGGEVAGRLPVQEYEATAIERRSGASGMVRFRPSDSGNTVRKQIRIEGTTRDGILSREEEEVEADIATVKEKLPAPQVELSDYPQATGQLCDTNNRRLHSAVGTLVVRGISRPHLSTFTVVGGKYLLYGLRNGKYLVTFTSSDYHAEQVISIPLKIHTATKNIIHPPHQIISNR